MSRDDHAEPIREPLPGDAAIDIFYTRVAETLSQQPWMERFACVLQSVTPVCHDQIWHVVDRNGHSLPLLGRDHWRLLALSGGRPVDLAGEWDGESVRPLGAVADGTYYNLWGSR